ncbi:MAG: hypothetical protein HY779_02950 [Rubrobacteridae bacterium]|nr:hypothetical protein [Rubrobacteridae bacterium]
MLGPGAVLLFAVSEFHILSSPLGLQVQPSAKFGRHHLIGGNTKEKTDEHYYEDIPSGQL